MANLVLTFAELLAGAVILDAGIKGDSIANVVKGIATPHPLPGAGGGGGSSASPAGSSSTASLSGVNRSIFSGHALPHANVATVISAILKQFPALTVSSTTSGGHVSGSFHYQGEAVDISGSPAVMDAAAKWINSSGLWRLLAEGIHNGGSPGSDLSVKYSKQVPTSYWGSSTWAGHANHLHIAVLDTTKLP